jgi:hypothetical protein
MGVCVAFNRTLLPLLWWWSVRTRRGCPGPPGGEGGATTSASSKTVAGSFLNAAAGSIVKTVASVLKLVKPAPISSTVTPIRKKMSTSCMQEASPPHKALRTPRIPLSANTNLWSPRRPNKCSRPDGASTSNQVKSSQVERHFRSHIHRKSSSSAGYRSTFAR